ncbi:parathyroid hormone-like hormone a [Gadus chalcogrammus]|uniref:parathyroid hormone-like hormone a n=1 Tax=Gadus chalcogrammus TaxID=1042646 RepID=UPI0024C3A5A2|nr:parathyroid hormone-like hormone a [Gadus chalcogrammus]
MFCSRRALQQWCFSLFLLCSPVPHYGRPIDALSNRMKRSVTHAQLMHDKGRTLQDFKRRMWLQELLHEVHTAAIRDLPSRPALTSGGSSSSSISGGVGGAAAGGGGVVGVGSAVSVGVGVGGVGVALPGPAATINLSTTGSTLHSKPPGGTKNLPVSFRLGEEEEELGGGTHLPQETNKSQAYKDRGATGKKKKKGRSGKRREGEKRKRRARSLRWLGRDDAGSGYHLGWRPVWGLPRARH